MRYGCKVIVIIELYVRALRDELRDWIIKNAAA